jgi:hypothetical protein
MCLCAGLLGVFTKMQKVTISFVMSVCQSVVMEQLGSHWTNFQLIWYLSIFWKSVEKIHISLTSDKNDRHFTWQPMYIYLLPTITVTSTTNCWNMWQYSGIKSLCITSVACIDMRGTARVMLVVQLPQTAQSKGPENGTQNENLKWKQIWFSALNTPWIIDTHTW